MRARPVQKQQVTQMSVTMLTAVNGKSTVPERITITTVKIVPNTVQKQHMKIVRFGVAMTHWIQAGTQLRQPKQAIGTVEAVNKMAINGTMHGAKQAAEAAPAVKRQQAIGSRHGEKHTRSGAVTRHAKPLMITVHKRDGRTTGIEVISSGRQKMQQAIHGGIANGSQHGDKKQIIKQHQQQHIKKMILPAGLLSCFFLLLLFYSCLSSMLSKWRSSTGAAVAMVFSWAT